MPANDEELKKQVHALFGDSQVEDGGYHSCYDGKWLDMTNEVCAVADFITDYATRQRIDELRTIERLFGGIHQWSTSEDDSYHSDERIATLEATLIDKEGDGNA